MCGERDSALVMTMMQIVKKRQVRGLFGYCADDKPGVVQRERVELVNVVSAAEHCGDSLAWLRPDPVWVEVHRKNSMSAVSKVIGEMCSETPEAEQNHIDMAVLVDGH